MLCYVVLCYVMLFYVMLCYVTSCYVIFYLLATGQGCLEKMIRSREIGRERELNLVESIPG